jgi:hypothetical protein
MQIFIGVQIHGLYSRKISPTVSIIYKEIKDYIKISKSKFTLSFIDLGYSYNKIGDNGRVLFCAVILVNPCFNQVHDIIPYFPKTFVLSQITTPIIYNRHLVVQNSSIITYFVIRISKINER